MLVPLGVPLRANDPRDIDPLVDGYGDRPQPERHVGTTHNFSIEESPRTIKGGLLSKHQRNIAMSRDQLADSLGIHLVTEVDALGQLNDSSMTQFSEQLLPQALLACIHVAEVSAPVDQDGASRMSATQRRCIEACVVRLVANSASEALEDSECPQPDRWVPRIAVIWKVDQRDGLSPIQYLRQSLIYHVSKSRHDWIASQG